MNEIKSLPNELQELIKCYHGVCAHIKQARDYFNLWIYFQTSRISYSSIANQSPTFFDMTSESYLETAFMGVARLYDRRDKKDKSNNVYRGFTLCYLIDEFERCIKFIDVPVHSLHISNKCVIPYIKNKWKNYIISDDKYSVTVSMSKENYPEFIKTIINMVRNKNKRFFDLRNSYFAHNDYDFGCFMMEKDRSAIDKIILDEYEELLEICEYCVYFIAHMFIKDKVATIQFKHNRRLDDLSFLFRAANNYVESLPKIETYPYKCHSCGRVYNKTLRRQMEDFKQICHDVCPYCFHDNGTKNGILILNTKTEDLFEDSMIPYLCAYSKNR